MTRNATPELQPPESGITEQVLLQRAVEMIPVLRERAADAEAARILPVESINDFLQRGFYRIMQPRRFGGYELGLRTFSRVMTQISRGCTSSGWVLCLTSAHTFHMAAAPEAGQVEMYGDDGDFRCPLILAPQGTATPVDGGYRINGRWNYNSGGEHANWLAVSAIVPGDAEGAPPADLLMVFFRREEYKVFDNWDTLGMRGTGSRQAVVEDVFVPEHRVISQPAWNEGKAPGFGVYTNPFYQTPHLDVFCAELSSICVGLGEAAIDAFTERAENKMSSFPPIQLLKHETGTQRHLGLARAKVDAAQAVLDRIINQQEEYAERIEAGTMEYSRHDSIRSMLLTQQVASLCDDAVELLYAKCGTSGTQKGQLMERLYRDMATIRTHYIMDAERHAENWGAGYFGLDEYTPY